MSTHPAQVSRVAVPRHTQGSDSDRSRAESTLECKGTKRSTKHEKSVKADDVQSGVSFDFPGTGIKTRAGRSDRKSVIPPSVQIDEAFIECLLRSGPVCLKELSVLAEEFRCLDKEDDKERAFVIETAQLCLRQACVEAEADIRD